MKKLGLSDKVVKVIFAVITVCCIYGVFSGVGMLWTEPQPSPDGKHTRNLITAADYMNVVLIVRSPRIGGAIAAMNSIVKNSPTPVHFNLVTDNVTMNYLWLWLEHSALKDVSYEIKGVTKRWLEDRIGIGGNVTHLLPYSSVFLHDLFPYLRGNVIVVEDDVIVQGDIAELKKLVWEKDSVAAFASNCDSVGRQFKSSQRVYASFVDVKKPYFRDLHLNASACSFASGIYVLDIDAWKEKNISEHVLHWVHLNEKEKVYKGEGPVLAMMIALSGKISTLDPLWNVRNLGFSPSSRYDVQFLRKAKLLHWSGPFKPWQRRAPYQYLWDKYFLLDPTGQFRIARKASTLKWTS